MITESANQSITPVVKALLDPLAEGVIVFSPTGEFLYANGAAEVAVPGLKGNGPVTRAILPQLSRLGARISPLWVNGSKLGEAVYLPVHGRLSEGDASTLADRERDAILHTLESTGWKLTQSAGKLGISRTTLWRRLRAYGLERDSRGRWSKPS
jgi:hypothetical protein